MTGTVHSNPLGHSYFGSEGLGIILGIVFPGTIQWYLLAYLCSHSVVYAYIAIGDDHIPRLIIHDYAYPDMMNPQRIG